MKLEVVIDSRCREPQIRVFTAEMTDEVNEVVRRLADSFPSTLTGFTEKGAEIIKCGDILRIFSESQKIYMQTEKGTFRVNARLYELEEELDGRTFVRISNSEIVNIQHILNMDVSLAGTVCIHLKGNIKTFVSRRYMTKINVYRSDRGYFCGGVRRIRVCRLESAEAMRCPLFSHFGCLGTDCLLLLDAEKRRRYHGLPR